MSHFTVLLKVSEARLARHAGDVEDAVAEMLAPYQENNMGDCPKQYLEFEDEEDEYREEYDTRSSSMIELESGERVYPWDDRFRVPGKSHEVPSHLRRVEVPHKERYPTFEAFVTDYHGRKERDPEKGRFGHWENPNAKWDGFQIGGRWRGYFPVKASAQTTIGPPGSFHNEPDPGGSDVCFASDLDLDRIATMTREAAEKFWNDWQFLLETGKERDDRLFGARSRALEIGLIRLLRTPEELATVGAPDKGYLPWLGKVSDDDERRLWVDEYDFYDRDGFLTKYIDVFNPVTTYAAVDDDGWHAPGEMGWWGCSSDTPDQLLTFKREFVKRYIKTAESGDRLVVVDCHI